MRLYITVSNQLRSFYERKSAETGLSMAELIRARLASDPDFIVYVTPAQQAKPAKPHTEIEEDDDDDYPAPPRKLLVQLPPDKPYMLWTRDEIEMWPDAYQAALDEQDRLEREIKAEREAEYQASRARLVLDPKK